MTSPVPAPLTFLPDILEEHLEELSILLPQRHQMLREHIAFRRHLVHIDSRLLAHASGVRAVGDAGLPVVAAFLDADSPESVEAATFALLLTGTTAARDLVRSRWDRCDAPCAVAMGEAFSLCAAQVSIAEFVTPHVATSPVHAVTLARAFARSGQAWQALVPDEQLPTLLADPDALVRREVWRLAMEAALVFAPRTYADALRDDQAGVRDHALLCAAWTGVQGTLGIARQQAQQPNPADRLPLRLLAVLGERADTAVISHWLQRDALGAFRFELAGLHGAASHVPTLLDAMASAEPRDAIAAGKAFTRITGVNVESAERATYPMEESDPGDDVAREFEDDGLLPDRNQALAAWERLAQGVEAHQRMCWGHPADAPLPDGALQDADLETQWWQLVRSRFWQHSRCALAEFDAFPAR